MELPLICKKKKKEQLFYTKVIQVLGKRHLNEESCKMTKAWPELAPLELDSEKGSMIPNLNSSS